MGGEERRGKSTASSSGGKRASWKMSLSSSEESESFGGFGGAEVDVGGTGFVEFEGKRGFTGSGLIAKSVED